jgi:alpha-L-fucosidase
MSMARTALFVSCLLLGACALFEEPSGRPEIELPTEDPEVAALHPLLAEGIESGPYEPRWASLLRHPLPAWFREAKIGISAHWGPYAVPGWTPRKDTPYGVAYAEWYWHWLESGNPAVRAYHREHYGEAEYADFFDGTPNLVSGEVDGFFAEDFDADRWMKAFAAAGARYFFITAKHHDGFCLWDSRLTDRCAARRGPRRDLLRELVDAARRHGLKVGFYYSFYEWYHPLYRGEGDLVAYAGPRPLPDADGDGKRNEYVDDFVVPQLLELIDGYSPDMLCFDGEWEHGYPYWRARQIVAYYYNRAAARGQEVLVNDRFGQKKEGVSDTRGVYGDFYHVEYEADVDRSKPWAMWRGFGNSYGFNRNEHADNILTPTEVVHMIGDVVSDNGNLEFNLGPMADGRIPEFELERLAAMGAWLDRNGAAIYGREKSPLGILPRGRMTHDAASRTLYYLVKDWPEEGRLEVPGLKDTVTDVFVLTTRQRLAFERDEEGLLQITVPRAAPDPDLSAIAIRYR